MKKSLIFTALMLFLFMCSFGICTITMTINGGVAKSGCKADSILFSWTITGGTADSFQISRITPAAIVASVPGNLTYYKMVDRGITVMGMGQVKYRIKVFWHAGSGCSGTLVSSQVLLDSVRWNYVSAGRIHLPNRICTDTALTVTSDTSSKSLYSKDSIIGNVFMFYVGATRYDSFFSATQNISYQLDTNNSVGGNSYMKRIPLCSCGGIESATPSTSDSTAWHGLPQAVTTYLQRDTIIVGDNLQGTQVGVPGEFWYQIIDTLTKSMIKDSTSPSSVIMRFPPVYPGIYWVKASDTLTGCSKTLSTIRISKWPLPVTLFYFTAESEESKAIIKWGTKCEIENRGFEILKSSNAVDFEKIGWVDGHGTTSLEQNYTFEDTRSCETIYYALKQIDIDGKSEKSPIVSIESNCLKQAVKVVITNMGGAVLETLSGNPEGQYIMSTFYSDGTVSSKKIQKCSE
jgi:hypothetical protein